MSFTVIIIIIIIIIINLMATAAAVRKEYARRSHEASEEWKQRMQRAEMTLEENDQTYKAVGAGIYEPLTSLRSALCTSCCFWTYNLGLCVALQIKGRID